MCRHLVQWLVGCRAALRGCGLARRPRRRILSVRNAERATLRGLRGEPTTPIAVPTAVRPFGCPARPEAIPETQLISANERRATGRTRHHTHDFTTWPNTRRPCLGVSLGVGRRVSQALGALVTRPRSAEHNGWAPRTEQRGGGSSSMRQRATVRTAPARPGQIAGRPAGGRVTLVP